MLCLFWFRLQKNTALFVSSPTASTLRKGAVCQCQWLLNWTSVCRHPVIHLPQMSVIAVICTPFPLKFACLLSILFLLFLAFFGDFLFWQDDCFLCNQTSMCFVPSCRGMGDFWCIYVCVL